MLLQHTFPPLSPHDFKEKKMKFRSLSSLATAALLTVSISAMAQDTTGKIHGKVLDPTGMAKTAGTVILSTDGKTPKYSFPISGTGEFKGEGIAPGTYMLTLRLPDTPPDKVVDQIENVKIAAGQDLALDDDMSRKEYLDKMTPDQKKQVEEFKKKNADIMKNNDVIKNLNADLAAARQDNKDKKYADADALMAKDTAAKPDGELLWYELGIAQLGEKKFDDAVTSFKKTAELGAASKKPNPELLGGAHSGMGEAYARSGKAPEAAAAYDEAAKANPPKAGFYLSNETVVFQNVGNADAQAAAADKAIAADPKSPLPYYLKGQALAGKITVDAKGGYVLPPGCAEAYEKYLDLAPNGQFAPESKAILEASSSKVESKYKAKK
jgi:tetratricopeptide (TPR) repeat protein